MQKTLKRLYKALNKFEDSLNDLRKQREKLITKVRVNKAKKNKKHGR